MLTSNQLNDIFLQKFGRNATPDEVTKYSGSDLPTLQSMQVDPTFANVKGTIVNKTNNQAYHNPEEFAQAAGLQAPPTDWSKFNFDTSYDPTQASSSSNPFDYQKTYTDALESTGANAAKQTYDSVSKQIASIDAEIQGLIDSKTAAAKASGGIVNQDQITAEAYQEKQTALIMRQSLATQQAAAAKAYSDALTQANQYTTDAEQSDKTNQAQQAEQDKTQYQSDSLNLNAQKAGIDPTTVPGAGTSGTSTTSTGSFTMPVTPGSAAAVNNVSGIKQNGQFVQYASPQDSVNATVGFIQGYQSRTPNLSLSGFVNSWVNGKPNIPAKGYTGQNVADYLSKLGIKTTTGTSIKDIDPQQLALAIAHFETGYTPASADDFNSFYTSTGAPDPSIADVVDPKTGVTPTAIFQNAIQYSLDGKTPSLGLGSAAQVKAQREAIQNKAAALVAAAGTTYPVLQSEYKAQSSALSKILPTYNQLAVNEQNAKKNFSLLTSLGQTMDANSIQSAIPLINGWLRTGQVTFGGNASVNNFLSTLVTSLTEYAKVVTGQTSGSAVTDSARSEMQTLLNSGLSTDAINSWIQNAALPDMANRSSSYLDQINGISSTIASFLSVATGVDVGTSAQAGTGNSSGAPSSSSSSSNDPLGLGL